jgi:RHS repeat-associated protein
MHALIQFKSLEMQAVIATKCRSLWILDTHLRQNGTLPLVLLYCRYQSDFQKENTMLRAPGVAVCCFLLSPALFAADSRQYQQTIQAENGMLIVPSTLITGGLVAPTKFTVTPQGPANHVEGGCSGTGFAAFNFSWNVSSTTDYPATITKTAPGPLFLNCFVNFGTNPATEYAQSQFSIWVTDTGFTAPGNFSSDICDPVATASGELHTTLRPDLSLGGPLPLTFSRTYGAFINANGTTTRIGANWMHNFEWLLVLNGKQAQVTLYGGQTIAFIQNGSAWQLTTPTRYGYQFVSLGNNTYQFLDPRTNFIYTFSGTGNTLGNTSVQDRNGNTLTVALPNNGTSQVSDGLGRTLTITYDSNGKLVKVVDQSGRSVSYAYTGNNLTSFTNANGKTEAYAYTTAGGLSGLLSATTLPLGNKPFSQTFDSIGRVATQSDSRGNATTLTYDHPVGSTSFKDPLGNNTTHVNRNYSDLLTYIDPDNQSVAVTYDANGRRTSVTDRLGSKVSETYHTPSGYLASIVDVNGNTSTNTWIAQTAGPFTFYVLSKVTYADATSISYTYDAAGNMLTMTDQDGKVSKNTYNSRGQILTRTDANGHVTTYAYNASDGTLASVTDSAGNTTTYSYDSAKRVSQIKFADGTSESFTYDGLDNVIKTTNANGKSNTTSFNDNNHPLGRTDALGNPLSIFYDTDDRVVKRTDRLGQSTSWVFNELGLQKSVTTPAGETYTTTYDSHQRPSAALDPSGKGLTFAYDKEDAPISITDPLSRKTTFTYDAFGELIRGTNPSGAKYTINRDKLERNTGGSDPANVLTSIGYDTRGLVDAIIVGSLVTGLFHNDSGQLTGLFDPNGGSWAYGYDSAGRLGSTTDTLSRKTTYGYDKRNRVNSVQTAVGQLAITYDTLGNLTRRLYNDGTDLSYTFDDNRRLTAASGAAFSFDANGAMTGSNGLGITRDADGRIASITYATGKTVKYAYNAVGLLTSITDWVSGTTTFTYDAAHQLISIKRPNGLGTQYTYDLDGRVATIVEDAGSSISVTRDAAGKKLSETRTLPATAAATPVLASGVLPLTFDAGHQVTGFTYDAMGRVTADSIRKYTWDLASRLKSYSGLDGSATAGYDGLGLRTSLTTSTNARTFVWNYATTLPSLVTAKDGSGDLRYYVYLPDGTLLYAIDAAVTNGTNARHFYHFDENGSTVLLTNDAGAITDSYAITPYGETVTQNGSTENPFTWLGQVGVMQEGSTGLYYMRARYYDSTTARFLSPDPIISASPLTVNPYQYAQANPLDFVDPNGLVPERFSLRGFVDRPDFSVYEGTSFRQSVRWASPSLIKTTQLMTNLLLPGLDLTTNTNGGFGRGEGSGNDGRDERGIDLGMLSSSWSWCGLPIGTARIKPVRLLKANEFILRLSGSRVVLRDAVGVGPDSRSVDDILRELANPDNNFFVFPRR